MEINGLPAHALIVHVAVVLGPVSALAGILYAAVPRWRNWLRWPMVVAVAIALVAIWAAYLTGQQVRDANTYGGPLAQLVEKHQSRAGTLRIVTTAFAVVAFVAAALHSRAGAVRVVLSALVVVGAVATLVYVLLTGDAGAQIAWYGING